MIDSWPYLVVGFLFSVFANGRYVIPIAAWIAPVFLLHAIDIDSVPALAGVWLALFASIGISYRGLDSSEYVVRRFGRTRDIGLATFSQLAELRFDERFDLVVCSDVIHYLKPAELRNGLAGIADMLEGVAFLELLTSADDVDGDRDGYIPRSPAWYLKTFEGAGLLPCGSHCYLGFRLLRGIAENHPMG